MLTGISTFRTGDLFVGMLNLNDISIDNDTNAICGISDTELLENFGESILHSWLIE